MSKCWYCNEELTTANYCDKHIGICTKCYGSMFKVSNEFVKELTDKIADLEAQLAESKEFLIATKWKVEDLEKQLTEKDNEILRLQEDSIRDNQIYNEQLYIVEEELNSARVGEEFALKCCDEANKLLALQVAGQHQDKVSFCIEQLELLKQKMANFDFPNNPKLYNNDMFCGGFDSHYIKTKEEIDNQIKQLKEGK